MIDAQKADFPDSSIYRAAFRLNTQACALTRLRDAVLVDVNDAWLHLLGYVRSEVVGNTTAGLGIWQDDLRRRTLLAAVPDGGSVDLEVTIRNKRGAELQVLFQGTRFSQDGESYLFGSLTDLTGRNIQNQELELSRGLVAEKQQGLEIVLNNMAQGILAMDRGLRITQFNQQLLELLEVDKATMAGFATAADLLRYQRERGDFGNNFEWVESSFRPLIEERSVDDGPHQYLRKTRQGRTLEVKSRRLADGGVVRTFSDVTHFTEAQAALAKSEARFRSLTELSSDWYWEQDANLRLTLLVGETFVNHFGDIQDLLGKTHWDNSALSVSASQWDEHRSRLTSRLPFHNFECQTTDRNGSTRWLSVSGLPVFDAQGVFSGYRGVGRDITEQKLREEENQRLAFYDNLTGLPNRRLLLDRLAKSLVTSGRNRAHGALLFIDLDNFKDLNDTLGHDVGDELLRKVAHRLVTCIRQGDTVSRFGGDEFVVTLDNLSTNLLLAIGQTRTVADKILTILNLPVDLAGKKHFSTPSIGITLFSGTSVGVDELLKRADLAMYQAKAAGRNTLRFFDPDMQAAVAQRATVEADLRLALERHELVLHYQTVVNHLGRIMGVEALVRWHHPQKGMVTPDAFIAVAEQTGLILPLGQWVLRAACTQLVRWQNDAASKGLTLAINISAREFHQPDFVERTLAAIHSSGANPNLLKLELTESLLLDDVNDAILKMSALRKWGVRFALDDFGTGYSSLSYLKQLPLDELKIDHSFVRDVLTDANDATIARTIIALAHSLGLQVVAEGVESEGQRELLFQSGCQLFQGYLFSKPLPPEALALEGIASVFSVTDVAPFNTDI